MSVRPFTRLMIALALVVVGAGLAIALNAAPLPVAVMALAAAAGIILASGAGHAGTRPNPPSRLPTQRHPANDEPVAGADPEAALPGPAAIDAIFDPLLLVRDGRLVAINDAASDLLGRHIVGEDIRTAIRHAAAIDHFAAERLVPDPGVELIGLGARDQRWLMRIGQVGRDAEIIHLADQSEAYATERMRVDFVANASHELRTPIAAILGYAETLSDADTANDVDIRTRFLGIMGMEARRMETLVNDLMSLSQIEAEQHRAPADAVSLADLAREVERTMKRDTRARGRSLILDVADGTPLVAGDRAQLSQLLHNLVDNAIKYGREDSPIHIEIAPASPNMVTLIVSDEGDGIAPEHLPRLTERFYRADPARSRSIGGTGLGLAIVKHIVERHRGRLSIASTPGTGTRVAVRLPRHD